MRKTLFAGIIAAIFTLNESHGQLAITEAMSSSANTPQPQHSDFWELTNFGTNAMDLTDYKFTDGTGDLAAAQVNADVFDGLTIAPGESVLFSEIEQNTTVQEFMDWWGAANLPLNVQVRLYIGPGFGSGGDGVQVWDAADNPVDSVTFDAATRGTTFTYNTNTGAFGVFTQPGGPGVFNAAVNADIGSPGYTAGPVPLSFTQEPTNLTVSAGANASFTASAQGLPKPKYQWYYNSNIIDGAVTASLVVTNAQTNSTGFYSVAIQNGVESIASSNALLTVNPAPSAPAFVLTPVASVNPTVGQTVTLTSQAVGFPVPSYQWQSNNVDLTGQTANQLILANLQTNDSATYTVTAFNTQGTNSASSLVTVTPKPKLFVTEVQSSEATNGSGGVLGHTDWWELSNLDDHPVNLRGYRFDDGSAAIASAFTFTNDIIIKPGESIVFVQTIPADNFRAWWGTNLSTDVQVTTYPDNSLGLSSNGDGINLWNPTATDNSDSIASVTFSAAPIPAGQSFVYDPDAPIAGIINVLASIGVNGGFAATNNADIGSPGRIVDPLVANIASNAGSFDLTWASTVNRSYTIEYKDDAGAANWTVLTEVAAPDVTTTISGFTVNAQRIYRVRVNIATPQ